MPSKAELTETERTMARLIAERTYKEIYRAIMQQSRRGEGERKEDEEASGCAGVSDG